MTRAPSNYIKRLKRRLDHLESRISQRETPIKGDYDRSEASALKWAMDRLRKPDHVFEGEVCGFGAWANPVTVTLTEEMYHALAKLFPHTNYRVQFYKIEES